MWAGDTATLPFNWEGGSSSDFIALDGVSATGLGSDYAAANSPYLIKLDGTGDFIIIRTDSQPNVVSIGVKMIGGATTSTITVQESSNGSQYTDVQALSISGSQNSTLTLKTTNSFAATSRYIKLLFTKGSNVGVGPISITKATPAYTVSATSNNNDYGTVSVDGIVITASPKSGYRVKSGNEGYTVTSGTATVAHEGYSNTFTVTPSSDCTVQINFEAIPTYMVTFDEEGGSCDTSSLTESTGGAGVELPTATISAAGWAFVGWATSEISNTTTRPTLYAAGSTYYPTADITLHAVFALEDAINKYAMATSNSDIVDGAKVVITSLGTNKYTLANNNGTLTGISNFTPTDGVITCANTQAIWTLAISNGNVTIANGGKYLKRSSTTVSVDDNSYNWTINESALVDDRFLVKDASTNHYLEHDGSSWTVYNISTPTQNGTTNYYGLTIYVEKPNKYDSNPSALKTPTVAFGSTDPVTLYLDGTTTNTNTATVTGVSKTINYSSSNPSVATVTSAGVVTAVAIGTATITASVDAELGVSTAASDTYTVTVKSTTTLAGIKAITSTSTVVTFTADLTDAVVTYVKGNHAFIQDASGAIYASCGSSLTVGKKINGAVSGSVKAANQIDEITAIDLSEATVTDGVIPSAAVITAATLAANMADYEGKLVSIEDATVTASLTNGSASGGKISDDSKVTEINLYAPDSNIEVLKDAEGTFNGYITLYSGSSIRFNIFEQSQISLTKNAPTAQTLTFASDAIVLDELTSGFDSFTPQTVSGAVGTVTYAISGDAIYSGFSTSDGSFTLNGSCGTATITATAAAKEVTVEGVTTPYTAAEKSYTVTVRPRYFVVFSVNGIETTVRQSTYGATIAVPAPADVDDYTFRGWSTATVSSTNDEPEMEDLGSTLTPEDNDAKYYAVFAKQTVGDDELVTFYSNAGTTGTDATSGVSMGATTNGSNGNSAPGFNLNKTLTMSSINLSGCKSPTSLYFDYIPGKSGGTYTTFVVKQYNSSDTELSTTNVAGTDHTKYMKTDAISLDLSCVKIVITSSGYTSNCFIDNIEIKATRPSISYEDYRTSLPNVEVTIPSSKFLAFCYGQKLDFSDTDVKAYKATVDEGKVVLNKVDVVPANEGVILYCETPDTYTINVTDKSASDVTGNELVGVTTRTQVLWNPSTDVYNYILQSGAFYKANGGYLKANRAYLQTTYNVTTSAPELEIVFAEDEAAGIKTTKFTNDMNDTKAIYNISGQRVAQPTKGLYIINGKKVIVR